jgi:hypothetical protein
MASATSQQPLLSRYNGHMHTQTKSMHKVRGRYHGQKRTYTKSM